MARTDKQLSFRVPEELREKLQYDALKNKRTLNSEILYRLEQSYSDKNSKDKTITRNIIFTEWHPLYELEDSDNFITHNENVRMACAEYMSKFFQDRPNYKLVKFEFKSRIQRIQRKDQEILFGIRIWYSYPRGE